MSASIPKVTKNVVEKDFELSRPKNLHSSFKAKDCLKSLGFESKK